MEESIDKIGQKNKNLKSWILSVFLVAGLVLVFSYIFLFAPSGNKDIIIHIPKGESINNISTRLKDDNLIKDTFSLKVFIKLFSLNKGIITGDYLIKKNSPVWVVAWQISRGQHNIQPIKVTIREGLTNEQISVLLADRLVGFKKDLFLEEVNGKQGYLFPDTYFFFPLDTTSEIIEKMSTNFNFKIKEVSSDLKLSGKKLSDIIIMASILEGEAGGEKDIYIISGILWKRISIGMPLQVDIDKSTYSSKGLPKEPLNNPGLASIRAAINIENSSYLYYLHEKNGNVHYAVSFDEHKRNISKYLK
jgi:UPF0755 protein